MENKIPTAEEIMINIANEHSYETWGELMYDTHEHSQILYTKETMIEFAKLHVEAALKAAYNNIEYTTVDSSVPYVVEESILNSYPLTNIK